jgi:hypothetical protein
MGRSALARGEGDFSGLANAGQSVLAPLENKSGLPDWVHHYALTALLRLVRLSNWTRFSTSGASPVGRRESDGICGTFSGTGRGLPVSRHKHRQPVTIAVCSLAERLQ